MYMRSVWRSENEVLEVASP